MSKQCHVYPIPARSKQEDVEKKAAWRTDLLGICTVDKRRKQLVTGTIWSSVNNNRSVEDGCVIVALLTICRQRAIRASAPKHAEHIKSSAVGGFFGKWASGDTTTQESPPTTACAAGLQFCRLWSFLLLSQSLPAEVSAPSCRTDSSHICTGVPRPQIALMARCPAHRDCWKPLRLPRLCCTFKELLSSYKTQGWIEKPGLLKKASSFSELH